MHPILVSRERLALYLGACLPGSGLLAALVTASSAMPWHQSVALSVPLGLLYAFVCLAAWYPCQAMPIGGSSLVQPITAHTLAALISSALWIVAGIGWSAALDRTRAYSDTQQLYMEMVVLFIVVGILLYGLSVAVHYLLIAFEQSREAESYNLELRVQTQEAELRAVQAQQDQALAEQELELARAIQRRLLPPREMGGPGYEVAARNLPARFVAGDFYDVFGLDRGYVALVVGYEALAEMIAATVGRNGPGALLDDLFERVKDVSHEGPHDDLTALVLERA